jgi:RecB family exonuclease
MDPMRLSYSSINTYETCPQKFKFQYEDRLPTSPSPALAFGDSLHQALHRFHSRPVPVAPSLEELQE